MLGATRQWTLMDSSAQVSCMCCHVIEVAKCFDAELVHELGADHGNRRRRRWPAARSHAALASPATPDDGQGRAGCHPRGLDVLDEHFEIVDQVLDPLGPAVLAQLRQADQRRLRVSGRVTS
jgi:hypothetical protein